MTAFAFEGDLDFDAIKSNTFEIEWPPKGGRMQSFPEMADIFSGRSIVSRTNAIFKDDWFAALQGRY